MSCRSTSTHSPSRAPSVPSGRKPAALAFSTTRSASERTWRSELPLAITMVSKTSVSSRTSSTLTLAALQLAVTTALDDMKAVNIRVLDIGQLPHVQHPDIHGLHVIERGRHGKLKRRDALLGGAQACAGGHVLKRVLLESRLKGRYGPAAQHSTSSRG